jgi:hypothetical protein
MKYISTINDFNLIFGNLKEEAISLFTEYKLFKFKDGYVYFRFDLHEIFKESIELFSVDSSLTTDMFILNNIFSDEEVNPDIITCLFDFLDKLDLEYDPITPEGELWLCYKDIKLYYGEKEFDKEMYHLFSLDYEKFDEYFNDA